MPPWDPVRADVAAMSALLFMSRTVTTRDGIVEFVPPYTSGRPNNWSLYSILVADPVRPAPRSRAIRAVAMRDTAR
eukprot:9476291-Pyramimonas_sp.AAC.2